jgi:septin family protein
VLAMLVKMHVYSCCFKGDSGLGKSTFVNSLFLTDLYADRKLRPPTSKCLFEWAFVSRN